MKVKFEEKPWILPKNPNKVLYDSD